MKKLFKVILYTIISVFAILFVVGVVLSFTKYDYLLYGIKNTYLKGRTTASIEDYEIFDNRVIYTDQPIDWTTDANYNKKPLTKELQRVLKMEESVAFLVVKNGQIIKEEYWDNYGKNSLSNSFSMAKTVVSMLVQIAIQDSAIPGWDKKLIDYFPKIKGPYAGEVTLGDLSSMSSGLRWNESYTGPLGVTARAYFDDELDVLMMEQPFVEKPGIRFNYQSGNTQFLAMALEKAVGKSISQYASEKLWKPLHMTNNALWSLDEKDGEEKAYCCINSNARDFARLGQLILEKGTWNGKSIIDSAALEFMATPRFAESPDYGYSFWLDKGYSTPLICFKGHLGQRIIVIPSEKMVIVRLGKKCGNKRSSKGVLSEEIYTYVDESLKMYSDANAEGGE